MIVDPTFTKHWKTKRLCRLLKTPAAPVYVINLWAHCQVSKKSVLNVPDCAIAEICDYDGEPEAFVKALLDCGFLEQQGNHYLVHQWDDYNNNLVSSWENGRRGGRPKAKTQPAKQSDRDTPAETGNDNGQTQPKPEAQSGYPTQNRNDIPVNPSETGNEIRLTDRRIEGEKEGKTEDHSPLPPSAGEGDGESVEADGTDFSPSKRIQWTPQTNWTGITDEDAARWRDAFPACDIQRQLKAMHEWLLSHPERAKKHAWMRFITGWLSREQERGGDMRGAKTPPAPRSESVKRFCTGSWADVAKRAQA